METTRRLWHYDHKKVTGPYGVCRICGREHDLKKDMAETTGPQIYKEERA